MVIAAVAAAGSAEVDGHAVRLGLALALNKNGELGAANEHWAALLAAQGGGRADASVRSKPS